MNDKFKLKRKIVVRHIENITNWKYDAEQYCMGVRMQAFKPNTCLITAAVTDMSMDNATDRRRVRQIAMEMIKQCDIGDVKAAYRKKPVY